jgi:uncharacterized membrane protein
MQWADALLRWVHVVAGVIWIGHLYFFNFVNGPFAKTLDAETKKKVVPELMPRALYFFRWGAAYTWVSGLLLLALVYYHAAGVMTEDVARHGLSVGVGLLAVLGGAVVYDLLWKSGLAANANAALGVSGVILLAVITGLNYGAGLGGRALYIHVGALFGTIMAMNVWMRIWPSQRKIIAAVKAGTAPDATVVGLAALRSRHNTFLSVPLLLTMVSNHFPGLFGFRDDLGWVVLVVLVVVGFAAVHWLYGKAASPAPTCA